MMLADSDLVAFAATTDLPRAQAFYAQLLERRSARPADGYPAGHALDRWISAGRILKSGP